MAEAVFWDVGSVILNADSVRRAHEKFVPRIVENYAPETSVEDTAEGSSAGPRSQNEWTRFVIVIQLWENPYKLPA